MVGKETEELQVLCDRIGAREGSESETLGDIIDQSHSVLRKQLGSSRLRGRAKS